MGNDKDWVSIESFTIRSPYSAFKDFNKMYPTTQQEMKTKTNRNLKAFQVLLNIGFEQINILKALPKLTGLSHPVLAKRLGVSRQAVTNTLNCDRSNRKLQKQIAAAYMVPVDVMFPEKTTDNQMDS